MKKIWFENIFGAEGAENIYKPDLFNDFQLGYHTTGPSPGQRIFIRNSCSDKTKFENG